MKLKTTLDQSKFCLELAKRLNDDIQKCEVVYGCIENHTQMENDLIRLRRELNDLKKMLGAFGYDS